MYLAFFLSMPNCGSWNGKWSGAGRKYVVVRRFLKHKLDNANRILNTGYYHYSWEDGWGAGITVKEVDSKQAAKLRKESQGFCGYEWMVDTIVDYGKPLANHEIEDFLNNKKISS
jgi:hypothetical protein